jgi:hypothetical protein
MAIIDVPSELPAAVARARPLIEAIMRQSIREQGPGSRTAAAWRWALTGHGPAPVSQQPGPGHPPTADEITDEARSGSPPMLWPPWRHTFDRDLDRQQARRVLRWLTGTADAIPLADPGRGRYVGARFHLARTDDELRQVRGWAAHGLREHGDLPAMSSWDAERPWQWPAWWMNAAWLRGAIAYLDWILGDTPTSPLQRQPNPLSPVNTPTQQDPRVTLALCEVFGMEAGPRDIEEEITVHLSGVIMQGHEGQPRAEPDRFPPPQWGEAVRQAHDWATGEDGKPPADHHGCGDYYPCPGDRRCSCEAAGYCLRGQCPACTDRTCNAAWLSIQERY